MLFVPHFSRKNGVCVRHDNSYAIRDSATDQCGRHANPLIKPVTLFVMEINSEIIATLPSQVAVPDGRRVPDDTLCAGVG